MEKILITGAAGFLGVNLAKKLLLRENILLYGVDDFSSSDVSNLYQLLKNNRYNFSEGDVLTSDLPYADVVFHFVGCGTFEKCYSNKYDYIYSIIKMLDKILNYTVSTGAKLILVHDFVNINKQNKKKKCYYNYLKLAENLVLEHKKTYKTNVKIARLPELYGGNVSKFNLQLIEKIIFYVLSNKRISLENNFVDYYTFIDDAIDGLLLLMDKYIDDDIVDISASVTASLSDFVQYILEYTNSKSKVEIKNYELIKPNYIPNTEVLKENFGFECSCDFKCNLAKTIDYFVAMYFS